MLKKLEDIELTIEAESDGVFAISLVGMPAIQENFVALSQHKIELKVVDEEKRIVVGYALIPEKRIYRKVKDKEFNVFFTAQTIEKTNELFMKRLSLNNVTSEHDKKVDGVSVIESWITEDVKHDKVSIYGIEPILGGWAIKMKIYNDEEWTKAKSGEYNGFSIEGLYSGMEKILASSELTPEEEVLNELEELTNNI